MDSDNVTEIVEEITMSRRFSSRDFGFGLLLGAAAGATGAYFFSMRKLETKYNKIAEDEIAEMREHYQNKSVALENTVAKPDLSVLVREQGYSVAPPMAVTPPTAVIVAANEEDEESVEEDEDDEDDVLEDLTLEEHRAKYSKNVFEEAKTVDSWNYRKELSRRTPVRPYVIHIDERDEKPYEESTLTYYEADDVLSNELDEALGPEDRERIVGESNLERFGHGSNDPSVVYIRNDKLEAQYEIILSPNSYAQDVHGFEHTDTRRRRRRKKSFDDE